MRERQSKTCCSKGRREVRKITLEECYRTWGTGSWDRWAKRQQTGETESSSAGETCSWACLAKTHQTGELAWPTFCIVHIYRFYFIYCGLRFYAQSHADNGHVYATAPCSAHALTQACPTMSYIPLAVLLLFIALQLCSDHTVCPGGQTTPIIECVLNSNL